VGANRQCAPPFAGPAPETRPILVEEAPRNFEGVAERLRATEELNRSLREEIRELRDRLDAETAYLQGSVLRGEDFDEIVGGSAVLSKVLHQVEQVAGTDSPVLILGETGTGKDLLAHAVHDRSRRKDRPLVIVNCAALPDALVESELFGYEKGAFTGAAVRTLGRFEMAHGGTILLDEIGEMPLGAQAKMLRVLEGGTFERLGSSKTMKVDVRVGIDGKGQLNARGGVGLDPLNVALAIDLQKFPLPALQPYLAQSTGLKVLRRDTGSVWSRYNSFLLRH
jgi:transcriptional regulator with GAF, ATPase, and Fis domain